MNIGRLYVSPPRFLFAWYDLWVGVFIKSKMDERDGGTREFMIYVLPLPTVGVVITFQWVSKNESAQCKIIKIASDLTPRGLRAMEDYLRALKDDQEAKK